MIIYGSRATHLKSAESKTTCPSCKTKGSLILSVWGRYAHVFWIPLFPIGKKGFSQCQHCKGVLETREMPEEIKREYKELKENCKAPIWQYIGLLIFIVIFAIPFLTAFIQVMRDRM